MLKSNGETFDFIKMLEARCHQFNTAEEPDLLTWWWFCMDALPVISTSWRDQKKQCADPMSKVVTKTDEAFTIYLLEVNKEIWQEEWRNDEGQQNVSQEFVEPDPIRFVSEEGQKKYEEIIRLVVKARTCQYAREWENELMSHCTDHYKKKQPSRPSGDGEKKTKKKRKITKNYDDLCDF